ncbi:MAG: hypothetical protein EBS07_04595 [Sphingobacteriia bacterium]|nr:hypothetical protein [Sphingobacteriia bacterium]
MDRRIIIFLLLSIEFMGAFGQSWNSLRIDTSSYQAFQNGEWKQVLNIANEAKKSKIDFYYLRLRTGWAAWNLKHTFRAAKEYEKALSFWSADTFSKEMLIRNLQFTGREAEAQGFYTNKRTPTFTYICAEVGIVSTHDTYAAPDYDLDGTDNIYGEQTVQKTLGYFNLQTRHQVSRKLFLKHIFTYLNINKEKQFAWGNLPYYPNPYTVKQLQYYIQAEYGINTWWKILPAYHFLHVQQSPEYSSFDSIRRIYSFSETKSSFVNSVVSLENRFTIYNFQPFIIATWQNLNDSTQTQLTLGTTWFPFGNRSQYLISQGTLHTQNGNSQIIYSLIVGSKLLNHLTAETGFTKGNIFNYTEWNGEMLYNVPDIIKIKGFITGKYSLKNMEWGITATYLNRERTSYKDTFLPPPAPGLPLPLKEVSTPHLYTQWGGVVSFKYYFNL